MLQPEVEIEGPAIVREPTSVTIIHSDQSAVPDHLGNLVVKMSTSPILDGATVEVIRHYLNSTAEQMRRTLVRTAFNPVIYEVLDFGISIYDRDRRLLSESSGILSFLGANDFAIHKGVEKVGIENLHPAMW